MGLFNKLGREVEKFAQNAKSAAEGGAEYECVACGERFHSDRDGCSKCGSSDVVHVGSTAGSDEAERSTD